MKVSDINVFKDKVKNSLISWANNKVDILFPNKPQVRAIVKNGICNIMWRVDKDINKAKAKNIDFRINDIAIVTDTEIRVIEIETDYRDKLIAQHRAYAEQVIKVSYESVKG